MTVVSVQYSGWWAIRGRGDEAVGDSRELQEVGATEDALQQEQLPRAPVERVLERRDPPFETCNARQQGFRCGLVHGCPGGTRSPPGRFWPSPGPPDETPHPLQELPAA